jgi:Flp pilus assembly protein TadD
MQEAVAFNPKNEAAWYGLGRCYYTEGELKDAQTAFQKALELKPNDARAESYLAMDYDMENQTQQAEETFKKSIALASGDTSEAGDEWPYVNYGSYLLEHDHAAEAIPLLEKAVAIAPRCAQCRGNLGRALVATKQPKAAVVQLEAAVALSPKSPKLHYDLGRAYRAAGEMDKARQELAVSAKLYGTKASPGTK